MRASDTGKASRGPSPSRRRGPAPPRRHQVLVAVAALDVEAGARIATQVVRLGSSLGDRDPHAAVVVHEIEDVGELRATVTLDGGQDTIVSHLEEVARTFEIDHPPQMLQPAP